MTDALEVLEATPQGVAFRGERVEVRPLPVGAIPKLVREARPVIEALLASSWLSSESDDLVAADVAGMLGLVEEHGEAVFKAVALAVERDAAWVGGADLADFISLATKVVEVNRDFFIQRIVPLLGDLARTWRGRGPTPSNSSSSTGTS